LSNPKTSQKIISNLASSYQIAALFYFIFLYKLGSQALQ